MHSKELSDLKTTIPKSCSECPIFKNSLFKDLNQELIDWLASKKHPHHFNKKDILFNQGQPVNGVYCHLDGLTKVVQKDKSDNILFSRLVLPGDTSGHRSLFINEEYKGSAVVISDNLDTCFVDKSDIHYLISKNSSLAKNLIIKISTELTRSENEAISKKQKSVRARLVDLLYHLANNYAEATSESRRIIKTAITKKDISNLLMVANETAIRLMSELKEEGLIDYEDKCIVINDINKLKMLTVENAPNS